MVTRSGTSASLLKRLWQHLSTRRRRQFVLIALLSLLSAFAEVMSLGTVLPFLGVLTAPKTVLNYPGVWRIAHTLGINTATLSPKELWLPLTAAFVGVALLASAIRMLALWASTRFTFSVGADISAEVYRRTLYQPYTVHVSRNSSEVVSGVIAKVGDVILSVLLLLMTFLSAGMVLLAIMGALLVIDAKVAIIASVVFGGSYFAITALSIRRLDRNSRRVADGYAELLKALQEGLGGIRDVLLEGTQEFYCDVYRRADRQFRHKQGENTVISLAPRYLMELVVIVLVAILAYTLSGREGGVLVALPMLGALAFGAQRMLPALQQVYTAWANMTGSRASLADTIALLEQPLDPAMLGRNVAPLRFESAVRFRNVRFRYSPTGPWVLDGLDLTIPQGARLGVVGATGCGKSTVMDLLMGLLLPTEGELLVDGEPLQGARIRAWQRAIAHVPQNLYLADATVAENIAFGVAPADIDLERVRYAATRAQIAEYFERQPEGYRARVGERGVRLSGGQRQRVGIARALYKQARVLILDEATSALDHATERSVMDAIEALDRNLTIVLVAHRLTTVRHCDTIVELTGGRAAAYGSYDEFVRIRPSFQPAARVS